MAPVTEDRAGTRTVTAIGAGDGFRLLLTLARPRPVRSLVVLVALVSSAVLEGIGLSALLSALALVLGDASGGAGRSPGTQTGPAHLLLSGLERAGLSPTLGTILLLVVGVVVAKNTLVFLANREVGYVVTQVSTELRLATVRALLAARWTYFVRRPVGEFANALATEAGRAATAYLEGASMMAALAQGVVYAAFLLVVSWKVALASFAAAIIFGVMMNRLLRMSRRAGRSQTHVLKSLIAQLTDSLQSVKPLKVMGRERQAIALLLDQTRRLNRALRRDVISREALRALQEPVIAALVAGGLYLALAVWRLPLSTTAVLVFVLGRTLTQIGKVQRFYQEMLVHASAFWSIDAMVRSARAEQEPPAGSATPHLAQGIRFERVGFAYEGAPILAEASLEVPAGHLVTIVGASGAGKTTLIDLLAGLLEPQQGHILIDGTPLGRLDRQRWRHMIGYVPQETLLLHDSVIHNVTLGDPTLTDGEAERALRAAGAWDFVAALPDGPDTIVGERGSRLSGGQRQRLAIARALVRGPALLILDEATSALDAESEREICQTLSELRGPLTILAVSHRAALSRAADRVYRLEQGATSLALDRLSPAGGPGSPPPAPGLTVLGRREPRPSTGPGPGGGHTANPSRGEPGPLV